MAVQTTKNFSTHQPLAEPDRDEFQIGHDLVEYVREYAREKPEVAMLWCFGVGFILGWKLKPW